MDYFIEWLNGQISEMAEMTYFVNMIKRKQMT